MVFYETKHLNENFSLQTEFDELKWNRPQTPIVTNICLREMGEKYGTCCRCCSVKCWSLFADLPKYFADLTKSCNLV